MGECGTGRSDVFQGRYMVTTPRARNPRQVSGFLPGAAWACLLGAAGVRAAGDRRTVGGEPLNAAQAGKPDAGNAYL